MPRIKPPPHYGQESIVLRLWFAQRGNCFHCNEPMLKAVSPHHPLHWSREHLWPRAQFSPDYGSIVLAHRECNNKRGARLPTNDKLDRAARLYASFDVRVRLRERSDAAD